MKIGILTYHSVFNFGANLQVLSTVEYLKSNGFDPVVINWVAKDLENYYNNTIPIEQANVHKKFLNGLLPCSDICRTEDDIIQVIENQKIEGVIIGSDAVMRHTIFFSRIRLSKRGIIISPRPSNDSIFPNPFWGSFILGLKEKIPVVVMSASSQNSNYKLFRGILKNKMKYSLSQFKFITVRDSWTKGLVKYITDGKILPPITPDPVFAFNQNVIEQYSKDQILSRFNLPENYILLSFFDTKVVSKDWLILFQSIAKEHNLHCVALTMPTGIEFDHPFSLSLKSPLGPLEWYGLIRYSSGYIGENMHPIIVALHNIVPFYSFDAYGIVKFKYFVNERSSKIHDILSQAGFLHNRISRLGKAYKSPSPEVVFQSIKNFDYSKCTHFSNSQLDRYNSMMQNITRILTENIE